MADVVNKGSLFEPELVKDLINKVKGKSALAALTAGEPIPFNGVKEFTFTMDDEVDLVAESGKKTRGSMKVEPVTIVPLKVEYGARISNEFMIAAEEEQLAILENFNDGFAKKVARGLDFMAIHGVNPRTGTASALIGNNCFDKAVTKVVTTGTDANAKVEAAIALIQGEEKDVSGLAMSTQFRSDLASIRLTTGEAMFPELAWGNAPSVIKSLPVQVNSTVSKNSKDLALAGDFETYFRWGFAKEIPMEIIEYGDPDNSGMDLKGYNQIYIRCEVYIGWGILDAASFALVQSK